MAAVRRKKLYFDIALSAGVTNQAFPCTQFRASYAGDKYGAVLDDLAPLVTGSPAQVKRLNTVAAWVPRIRGGNTLATSTAQPSVAVDFINATTVGSGATQLGTYGETSIFTRHFAVRVSKAGAASFRGLLYVQRQHSSEV